MPDLSVSFYSKQCSRCYHLCILHLRVTITSDRLRERPLPTPRTYYDVLGYEWEG